MGINPNLAQDVFKDVGEHVQFTILKLNRKNHKEEQEAIVEFADRSQAIIRSLKIRDLKVPTEPELKVSIGFSYDGWTYLFNEKKLPNDLRKFKGLSNEESAMPAVDGDLFFHIRGSNEAVVYEAQAQFRRFLEDVTTVVDETQGFRYFEGRSIIGFIDGTEAPDEKDAASYALIGEEDPEFINGSYAFAQKWEHNMSQWDHLSTETQEKAIGREKFTDLELEDKDKLKNAHNVTSKYHENGEEMKIIRMNVPYSKPASGKTGTYFIGYSKRWTIIEGMLKNMIEKSDFLLSFSTVLFGQVFFIPSRETLEQIANGDYN